MKHPLQHHPIATPFGAGYLEITSYGSNGALAVQIMSDEHEDIATISVNLDHGQPCVQSGDLPEDHFYLDVNNLGGRFISYLHESNLMEPTDLPEGVSGYCIYPVWRLKP